MSFRRVVDCDVCGVTAEAGLDALYNAMLPDDWYVVSSPKSPGDGWHVCSAGCLRELGLRMAE